MAAGSVVVLGDLNVDAVLAIPAYPAPGGDALASHAHLQAGGSAANTAVVLAKLGLAPRLIARAGRELWGDWAQAELQRAGVDTALVQRDEAAPTGLFFIPVTPDGERTMFGLRGANVNLDPHCVAPALANARWLHLSGYALLEAPQREAALRAIEVAEAGGVPISLDVGRYPALQQTDLVRRLLPRLALCVLDLDAAQAVLGDRPAPAAAAEAVAATGVGLVGLTLGAEAATCGLARAPRRSRLSPWTWWIPPAPATRSAPA
jgi:ribokinase